MNSLRFIDNSHVVLSSWSVFDMWPTKILFDVIDHVCMKHSRLIFSWLNYCIPTFFFLLKKHVYFFLFDAAAGGTDLGVLPPSRSCLFCSRLSFNNSSCRRRSFLRRSVFSAILLSSIAVSTRCWCYNYKILTSMIYYNSIIYVCKLLHLNTR